MVFPSIEFAIFFPLVLAISWALMSRPLPWKLFILAASYLFYAAADPILATLLAGVTLGCQAVVVGMHRSRSQAARKRLLILGVAANLGVLGIFKYYGFFTTEINDLLSSAGLGLPVPVASIVLPIGISFYTFQALSYVVDVYRGDIERPAKLIDFAVFEAFFPQLVAGPIVRARELLPQIATPRSFDDVKVGAGVFLVGLGLVKKVVLADYIAREVVNPVFAVPEAYSAPDLILASYGFAAQVYCDFSGYSDIAIGVALLMGFAFPINFNRPYSAVSFADLWRRWHMTLSRFMRDYIYFPLGGGQKGPWRGALNLMVTMTLIGLWHGAAWTFIVWGSFMGVCRAGEELLKHYGFKPLPPWLGWLVVFQLFVLGAIFFRAPDVDSAFTLIGGLADWSGDATLWTLPAVGAIVLVIAGQLAPQRPIKRVQGWIESLDPAPLATGLAATIALVVATVPSGGVPPFIYFQF